MNVNEIALWNRTSSGNGGVNTRGLKGAVSEARSQSELMKVRRKVNTCAKCNKMYREVIHYLE
jgi:hypothetical protein